MAAKGFGEAPHSIIGLDSYEPDIKAYPPQIGNELERKLSEVPAVAAVAQQTQATEITASEIAPYFKKWEADLTDEQKAALHTYTTEECRNINGDLRKQKGDISKTGWKDTEKTILSIDAAIKASPGAPRDMTVYRRLAESSNFKVSDLIVGGSLHDYGYQSTSISPNPVVNGNIQLIISVPKGSPGVYIAGVSDRPGQQEFLLPRGTRMNVSRIETDLDAAGKKNYIVYATVAQ